MAERVARRGSRQLAGNDRSIRRTPAPGTTGRDRREHPLQGALGFLQCLWELNHALERLSSHMVQELGITAQQRLVIRCIGRYPGMTVGDLAQVLHLDPATVSVTVKRLHGQRLVARRRDDHDRRRVSLWLTVKGRGLSRPAPGTVEHAVDELFEAARPKEIATTRTLLGRLIRILDAERERGAKRTARRAGPVSSRI